MLIRPRHAGVKALIMPTRPSTSWLFRRGHGIGGAYGVRKLNDFFVHHLLGIDPPIGMSSKLIRKRPLNHISHRSHGIFKLQLSRGCWDKFTAQWTRLREPSDKQKETGVFDADLRPLITDHVRRYPRNA